MLLPLVGRNIAYDLVGPEHGPVVAFSHSLAADSGMWAEQVPALVAAGYRVLRVDLRGHGGSGAPPGPYTIDQLADDIVLVLDAISVKQCHFVGLSIGGMIGQSLGIHHAGRVKSLMLCDTQACSPADAATRWGPRIEAVLKANSLEPIADATIARWLTTDYKNAHPARWQQIRDTIAGCTAGGYTGVAYAEYAHLGSARRTEATGLGTALMFSGGMLMPTAFSATITASGEYGLAYGAAAVLTLGGGALLAFGTGKWRRSRDSNPGYP